MSIVPQQTLYIQNLHDKLSASEMRRILYALFAPHGRIVYIGHRKNQRMRGQAHIGFLDVPSATNAMRALQGFELLGKPLRIAFAKNSSNALKTLLLGDGDQDYDAYQGESIPVESAKRSMEDSEMKPSKRTKQDVSNNNDMEEDEEEEEATLHRVLFVEKLPPDATQQMLQIMLKQYAGFREVRLVPGKPGIAFAEFQTADQAASAKNALNGIEVTKGFAMRVTFAKK